MLAFAETDPVRRLKLLGQGFLKADGEPYNPASAFKKALLQRRCPICRSATPTAVGAIIEASDRLALFRMLEGTRRR